MKLRTVLLALMATMLILGIAPAARASESLEPGLDAATEAALLRALEDERHAEAIYRAVLDRHGDVRPFAHIVQAEARHQQYLLDLLGSYALVVPANPWKSDDREEIPVAETLQGACREAVEAEQINIALYDDLLVDIEDPDVRQVFERLQAASREHHLPAFQRCAQGRRGPGRAAMGPRDDCCCRRSGEG